MTLVKSFYSNGAVLSQTDDEGKERVVAYASRVLTKSERRYCVICRELLAVVTYNNSVPKIYVFNTAHELRSVEKFSVFTTGRTFYCRYISEL